MSEGELIDAYMHLTTFHKLSSFQQNIIAFLAGMKQNQSDQDLFSRIFLHLDVSRTGHIVRKDLEEGLKSIQSLILDPEEIDIKATFNAIDTKIDGHIDYIEFQAAVTNRERLLTEENIRTAFQKFDIDKNGEISLKEI